MQDVVAKLGRSSGGSHIYLSASWKFQLLALALPAYASPQDSTTSQPGTTSQSSAVAPPVRLAAAVLGQLAG